MDATIKAYECTIQFIEENVSPDDVTKEVVLFLKKRLQEYKNVRIIDDLFDEFFSKKA